MSYRIVEENGLFFVEESNIWSLFIWLRWTRFGGSFGNEDVKYKSLEDAEAAINSMRHKQKPKIVKWLR